MVWGAAAPRPGRPRGDAHGALLVGRPAAAHGVEHPCAPAPSRLAALRASARARGPRTQRRTTAQRARWVSAAGGAQRAARGGGSARKKARAAARRRAPRSGEGGASRPGMRVARRSPARLGAGAAWHGHRGGWGPSAARAQPLSRVAPCSPLSLPLFPQLIHLRFPRGARRARPLEGAAAAGVWEARRRGAPRNGGWRGWGDAHVASPLRPL